MANTVYNYKYYIEGRQIAIVQKQLDNLYDPYLRSNDIVFQTPSNSDTAAIQIKCTKKPTAPTDETSTIDLPEMLTHAVESYIKARLLEDAGDDNRADKYMKDFLQKIERHSDNMRVGTAHVMIGVGAII